MKLLNRVGLDKAPGSDAAALAHSINLKLAALGCPTVEVGNPDQIHEIAWTILNKGQQAEAEEAPCPVDARIEAFLQRYFGELPAPLPRRTLVLDQYGVAKMLSLPHASDSFNSEILSSYRVKQGVLHNPKSDRRTTQGIFHVVEGGLPIPADKMAVPKVVFQRMLRAALNPPDSFLRLPYTSDQREEAKCFVSLLLRPMVCPEVPGYIPEKTLEVRFFVPGSLVANLDFVESIFGNAGDPYLPENDAGLDVEHWSGHTGCVILAPHLVELTKKELGLPHYDQAGERQRREGMCWREEGEKYNGGNAFKLTCRDESGVIVTMIADNYFGYCKKEVKTQISFAANLFGLCEEEHAGGALVFPSYDLGVEFSGHLHVRQMGHSFKEVLSLYADMLVVQPEGHAVDRHHPNIVYVPENVHFDLLGQTASWPAEGGEKSIQLTPGKTYVRPSGYKVRMEKAMGGKGWHLVGTVAEPTFCHKPCTVSGGGKSEISKPISDAIIQGPVFVFDFERDFAKVAELIDRDYSQRFNQKFAHKSDSRGILSEERSLGSVIKLLTPSQREYNDEYNKWLESIPQYIKELVFVVKRFHKPEWEGNWRKHFTVDTINGIPGNELKCDGRMIVSNFLRVGFEPDGSWRTFGLRNDFHPADKVQMEDDISASVVVPTGELKKLHTRQGERSVKFLENCEYRLFQRPDDAIHRGYDKVTESDFSKPGNFFSNYEPIPRDQVGAFLQDAIGFDLFTDPMKQLVRSVAADPKPDFFVSSSNPRIVDGKPSKNPRYLQVRPDLTNPEATHVASVASRLGRRIGLGDPLHRPVDALLPGRRNNPPDVKNGIRPLAVYNPIHFMDLPELFMEYICSMTGKSPSTTGAGSEGALTKGPFNALPPIYDLNNALVSNLLTGHGGFVTAAGYVGPKTRVDHDISLLVPEIWSRMSPEEREPEYLLANGYLERIADMEFEGRPILASRLGCRITQQFAITFFGRMFNHPHVVLTPEMLRPELQDMAVFADGMENIVTTQKRVAALYFEDGSIEWACPPLKALLHIMCHGHHENRGLNHPQIRALFTVDSMLKSDWYKERLLSRQMAEISLADRQIAYLEQSITRMRHGDEDYLFTIKDRLAEAKAHRARVASAEHLKSLVGTLGRQPIAKA